MRLTELAHETGLTVDAIRTAMVRLGLTQPLNAISVAVLRDYAQTRQQRVDHVQDYRLRLPETLPPTYHEIRRVSGCSALERNASPAAFALLRRRLAEMLLKRNDLPEPIRTRALLERDYGRENE